MILKITLLFIISAVCGALTADLKYKQNEKSSK